MPGVVDYCEFGLGLGDIFDPLSCQQLSLGVQEQRIVTLIDQDSIKVEIDCFLLVFDDGPGQYTTLYASMVDKGHFPLIVLHLIVEIVKGRIIKPCKFYPQRHHILTAKLV